MDGLEASTPRQERGVHSEGIYATPSEMLLRGPQATAQCTVHGALAEPRHGWSQPQPAWSMERECKAEGQHQSGGGC
jgi:hypothetical protein